MLKVLIVDDEMLTRTKLKMLLERKKNIFDLYNEAVNGKEALQIIEKEQPDIVLTDILMPVMDGLKLSDELRQKYPEIKLIALSNYDDFKYVKGILKNGAIDYILKHELDEKTLLDALKKAKDAIELDKKDKSAEKVVQNRNKYNLLAVREKFIIQLLTGVYKNEEEIENHLDALDIKIETKNIILAVIVIDNYKLSVNENELKNVSSLEYAVINISQEVLNDFGNGIICHISNEKFIILLSFADYRSRAQMDQYVNQVLGRISGCLKEFMNISVSYILSELITSIENLSINYEKVEKHLKDRFYKGKSCLIKSDLYIIEKESLEGLNIEEEKKIIACLKLRNKDELNIQLLKIFDNIIKQRLSITSSQLIFGDLLSIINRICKDNSIDLSLIYSIKESPNKLLEKYETISEIKNWFLALFEKLFQSLCSNPNATNSEYVRKAINFIRNHFCEQISLAYVAEQINISSAYLSTLFKDEIGVGFVDFVTQLRLDKAKVLLEEGNLDLKGVVNSCGFNDYSYFIKIFRKKTGVTPKEYMNNIS